MLYFNGENMENIPVIKGVAAETAVKNLGGNLKAYLETLGSYRREIKGKIKRIRETAESEDLSDFVILVHGVKGASRMLGITELGEKMYSLELAGKSGDRGFISENLDAILKEYEEYEVLLAEYDTRSVNAASTDKNDAAALLERLKAALEDFESEEAERLTAGLGNCCFSEKQRAIYDRLLEAVDNIDYFTSLECVNELTEAL